MIYFNEKQAAQHVGVSRSTIINWMRLKTNPLPHIRWGPRSVRIIQSELEQWLEQYRAEKTDKLLDILREA